MRHVPIRYNKRMTGDRITGLVLAGGRAQRMGGIDKGLVPLAGRPLVEWVIDRLEPQTGTLLINANRSESEYGRYGYPVIPDRLTGFCGPLAGIAAGLAECDSDWLLTCPCDSPLLPPDLAERLFERLQRERSEIAVAHNGERLQPVFALLARTLLDSLEHYLKEGGRKIDRWYEQHRLSVVDFSDRAETFRNINTPEDVTAIEETLAGQGQGATT